MEQVKNAANKAAVGAVAVGGYGSIGLLVEAIVHHFFPWIPGGGLVTMATTTALHSVQRAWQGWLETTRGARANQEVTDKETPDQPLKKET